MKESNQQRLPHYFREVKYQQNRPISAERQAAKQAKREQRNQKHKQILDDYRQKYTYYDQQADEWAKHKYYIQLPKIPDYQSLNQLLSSTFSHARRRQNIFPIVDRHPDFTLRCVYSGRILSDQKGNLLEKCDQEHSFPQSFQRGTKSGTGRDMHAIFAACKSANGSRGNTPFGIHSQNQKKIQVNQFGSLFSGTSELKSKTYIPKLNSGAIARSTLYILVCYKGCANQDYLPKETIGWLIETAATSQVTEWQKHRNQQLHRLQGNRNPFIDFPEWAHKIDFAQGWQK